MVTATSTASDFNSLNAAIDAGCAVAVANIGYAIRVTRTINLVAIPGEELPRSNPE
jgi:hypothetical protein